MDQKLFDCLCQLIYLEKLSFSSFKLRSSTPTSLFLPFSKLSKRLNLLNLEYCSYIDMKNIQEISQLISLQDLSFSWYSNSVQELQSLSQLKRLKYLTIKRNDCRYSYFETKEEELQFKEMIRLPNLI